MASPLGWDHRIAMALGWSIGSVVVLASVDNLASEPARDVMSGDGAGLIFCLCGLYVSLAIGVLKLSGLPGLRAVSFGSLVLVGMLVPCVVRLVDVPIEPATATLPPLYSRALCIGFGVVTFVIVLGLHTVLARSAACAGGTRDQLRPDYPLFGMGGISVLIAVPVIVSSLRLPTRADLQAAPVAHARLTVPDLEDPSTDEFSVFQDDRVIVTAVRTHALPHKIARLTVDLRDGVGSRSVAHVAVGGGETLRLSHRRGVIWELCNVGMRNSRCVELASFVRGASGNEETRPSAMRGYLAPSSALVALTVALLVGTLAIICLGELTRRRAIEIARGRQATVTDAGVVESDGNHYTLASPAYHPPGPLVLLGATDDVDPYRGTRVAARGIRGTIEQHLARVADERAALRPIFVVACVLVLTHPIAAGIVGNWGF